MEQIQIIHLKNRMMYSLEDGYVIFVLTGLYKFYLFIYFYNIDIKWITTVNSEIVIKDSQIYWQHKYGCSVITFDG